MAAAFLSRWQNDQGELLDHQLFVVRKTDTGSLEIDNRVISGLFTAPVQTLQPDNTDVEVRKTLLDAARDHVEIEMTAALLVPAVT
jgi:hypothetical protein